jgi:hypothetical protein
MAGWIELIERVAAVAEKRLAQLDEIEAVAPHFHRHVAVERLRWAAMLMQLAAMQIPLFLQTSTPRKAREPKDPVDKLFEDALADELKGKKRPR